MTTVVLLHGLHGRPLQMSRLASYLARRGFRVLNLGYDSRAPLADIAAGVAKRVAARVRDGRVAFVGHSLGALVARAVAAGLPPERLGRMVLLCPPNAGAALAHLVPRTGLSRKLAGDALFDLVPGSDALSGLPPARGEVGVVAGDARFHPLSPASYFAALAQAVMPLGRHDGAVSVAETHLEGEADHIVLQHSHDFLPLAADTARQVESFLSGGRFIHPRLHEERRV